MFDVYFLCVARFNCSLRIVCAYCLIVQGTYSGLTSLSPRLLEMAQAMRLTSRQTLLWACLPLSRPAILNGIKVSAVINVGTATLAVFVGGGGGAYIVMGLALNDTPMILNGAIPAAIQALLLNALFKKMIHAGKTEV